MSVILAFIVAFKTAFH